MLVQLALLASACNFTDPSASPGPGAGVPNDSAAPSATPEGNGNDLPGDTKTPPTLPGNPSEPQPEPANGQTGSPGAVECYPGDGSCSPDLNAWTQPFGRAELAKATCAHLPGSYQELPVCQCTLHVTPTLVTGVESREPYETIAYPGNRPGGCSEYSRTPGACLYCAAEFSGCDIDDARSCDATCADVAERYDLELQKTFTASVRVARCNETSFSCENVTQVGASCYAGNPNRFNPAPLDCSLSDEELLEQANDYAAPCAAPAAVTCTTASDCPGALACHDGRCVFCEGRCSAGGQGDEWACDGYFEATCAEGEQCSASLCVPTANITCRSSTDCASGEQCLLSGIDANNGRGNADTRSFCRAAE